MPRSSRNFASALLLLICCCTLFPARAQIITGPYDTLIHNLQSRLWHGDKQAIPALGGLLGNNKEVTEFLGHHRLETKVSEIARRTLGEWCFFEPDFDLKKADDRSFAQFWKARHQEIRFSPLARAYFITPPEKRTCTYELQQVPDHPNDDSAAYEIALQRMRSRLRYGHVNDAQSAIGDIAKLRTPQAHTFLLDALEGKLPDSLRFPDNSYLQSVAWALRFYPDDTTVKAIRKAVDAKFLEEENTVPVLKRITNLPVPEEAGDSCYKKLLYYIDILQTAEDIRKFSYGLYLPFSPDSFASQADYLGTLLNMSPDNDNLEQNALQDLVATHDPVALKYIAGQVFQRRNRWNAYYFDEWEDTAPAALLRRITGVELSVLNRNGTLVHEMESYDYTQLLNYLVYWSTHYSDYKWDDAAQRFVNTRDSIKPSGEIEALILQLQSADVVKAVSAYRRLTECDAQKVRLAAGKNSELIDKAHSLHFGALPMFPERRLPQQAALTEFCRKNGYAYRARPEFLALIDSLDEDLPLVRQYRLESRIIAAMNFDDATALEYECSLGEYDTYSTGRILDEFYGKHFTAMVDDPRLLRLYLKKAQLYDRFGIIGSCGNYLWKFYGCSEEVKAKLRALAANESDTDVLASVNVILENKTGFKKQNQSKPKDRSPDEKAIVQKVAEAAALKEPYARAEAFLRVRYQKGFTEWISDPAKSKSWLDTLRPALEYYLRKEGLSEYTRDEVSYLLSYAGFVTETFDKQLEAALAVSGKTAQRVLLTISYAQVPVVLKYWDRLKQAKVFTQHTVLRNDLGLPVDDEEPGWKDTLSGRIARLGEKEVYRAYLDDLGMNVLDAKGALNYANVHHALRYGPGLAFAGGGGGLSSAPLYTLLRYLELEHGTRLGFPAYFYHESRLEGLVVSPYDRIQAWIDFLTEKKLMAVPAHPVPSFAGESSR